MNSPSLRFNKDASSIVYQIRHLQTAAFLNQTGGICKHPQSQIRWEHLQMFPSLTSGWGFHKCPLMSNQTVAFKNSSSLKSDWRHLWMPPSLSYTRMHQTICVRLDWVVFANSSSDWGHSLIRLGMFVNAPSLKWDQEHFWTLFRLKRMHQAVFIKSDWVVFENIPSPTSDFRLEVFVKGLQSQITGFAKKEIGRPPYDPISFVGFSVWNGQFSRQKNGCLNQFSMHLFMRLNS